MTKIDINDPRVDHVRQTVAEHLDAIRELFKDPVITLLVRPRDAREGTEGRYDFIMSDDFDLGEAIRMLERGRSGALTCIAPDEERS